MVRKILSKVRDFYKVFFFKWYCILTSPLIILLSKFLCIIYLLFLPCQYISYVYNIKIRSKTIEDWVDVNWAPPQCTIYESIKTLLLYTYTKQPRFFILKNIKLMDKKNLKKLLKSAVAWKKMLEIFLWICWAMLTSLPKRVIDLSFKLNSSLKKAVNFKKHTTDILKNEMDRFVQNDFNHNLMVLGLKYGINDEGVLIINEFDATIGGWFEIFTKILFLAEYYNYKIYIIKNFPPCNTNENLLKTFKNNYNIAYIHEVFDLNNCFLILCLKNNFKLHKILNFFKQNLNTKSVLYTTGVILHFLATRNWSKTNFQTHKNFRSLIGNQIFSEFLDIICGGVVDILPKKWYLENRCEKYNSEITTPIQRTYKKLYQKHLKLNKLNLKFLKKIKNIKRRDLKKLLFKKP